MIAVPIIAAALVDDDRHTAAHGAVSGESLTPVNSAFSNARPVEEPLASTDHSGQNSEQNATHEPFGAANPAKTPPTQQPLGAPPMNKRLCRCGTTMPFDCREVERMTHMEKPIH